MLPKAELEALIQSLGDAILEAVPGAVEYNADDGVIAYRFADNDTPNPFCLLHVHAHRLELRFPECPDIADPEGQLERDGDGPGCRMVFRKRTDIPGEFLAEACRIAAGSK